MAWAKDWIIAEHIHEFSDKYEGYRYGAECRYIILDYLLLRSNQRLRCWVGVERIKKDTGITSDAAIAGALKWLFDRGALYNVPPGYRVNEEKKLQIRKYVFQITGIINLKSGWTRYLHLPDEHIQSMMYELASIGYPLPEEFDASPDEADDKTGASQSEGRGASQSEGKSYPVFECSPVLNPSSDKPTNGFQANGRGGSRRIPQGAPPVNPRQEVSSSEVDYSLLTASTLVQYVMAELQKKTFMVSKKVGKLLTSGQIVQDGLNKVSYASPVELFREDAIFREFVYERMNMFKNIGDSTVENCLLNICRLSRQDGLPSADGKRKLPSYHFWKAAFTTVANLTDAPIVVKHSPFPVGFVDPYDTDDEDDE